MESMGRIVELCVRFPLLEWSLFMVGLRTFAAKGTFRREGCRRRIAQAKRFVVYFHQIKKDLTS